MDIRKLMSLMACFGLALGMGFTVGCEADAEVAVDDDAEGYEYSAPEDDDVFEADWDQSGDWEEGADWDDDEIELEDEAEIDADVDID